MEMDPTDLSIEILQGIRNDLRESTEAAREDRKRLEEQMNARFEQMDRRFEQVDRRFEVVESTLTDLAEQMVFHSKALRTLLDRSDRDELRYRDLDQRVTALEEARSA